MSETPVTPEIKARARKLWEDAGSPQGREQDYLERARELAGLEATPDAGLEPASQDDPDSSDDMRGKVEEAAVQENLGEFPGVQTDQGDRKPFPSRR